jgi:hypothetical protein
MTTKAVKIQKKIEIIHKKPVAQIKYNLLQIPKKAIANCI